MNVTSCNALLRTAGLRIDRALVRRCDTWTLSAEGTQHRAESLGEAFRRARFFASLERAPRAGYDRRAEQRAARAELTAAFAS